MMRFLNRFVDTGDGAFRGAAALAAVAAVFSIGPLAGITYVLVRAMNGQPVRDVVVAVTAIVAGVAIVQIPLAAAGSRLFRTALERRAERLRVEVIDHLRRVPSRTLADLDPGQILATVTLGLDQATGIINGAFDALFAGAFKAAGAIAVVAAIDWRIALVALAFLPVSVIYVQRSRIISSRATPRLALAQAEGSSRFFEYVESVALLRSFGATAERLRRLALAIAELKYKAFENTIAPMTFGVVALFFIQFGFAIAMMVGVLIAGHNVGVQYILAFTLALAYFQTLFEALDGFLCLRDATAHVDIVEWLLALPATAARTDRVPQRHDLALEGIGFAYDRGPVLHDVAIRFPERAVTAIVGPSGAGKSALAGVIAGIWEPAAGSVRVGGVDIGTLTQEARAHTLAVVFQETQMFEESVARNIGAGRPSATRAEILRAAQIAGCDEFVLRLPEGYDTIVRPDGANFSLGERQRIAIARMLLSEAPVVVLDECTASLDAAAERAVHRAIAVLAETKTVVLITHRLGTVRHVPHIVVLAAGTVAEAGTHEELLRAGGEYARLWSAHERARHWKLAG